MRIPAAFGALPMDLARYKRVLAGAGVTFESGLTEGEIRSIEERYRFKFPPDLRDYLTFAIPISKGFVNWRCETEDEIVNRLQWPYDGICFDIEHNAFWPATWGPWPPSLDDAFAVAKSAVDAAPKLIPIYGHRYIPDRPHQAGNPVFSVYQTDIIYYGSDLADYLENEFAYYFGRTANLPPSGVKNIEFWSWLVGHNAGSI